jgi:hypothetical protein
VAPIARSVEDAVSLEPHECVSDSFSCGVPNIDVIATIVISGRAKLPTVDSMGRRGATS